LLFLVFVFPVFVFPVFVVLVFIDTAFSGAMQATRGGRSGTGRFTLNRTPSQRTSDSGQR
jgi:hypothetical protein